MKNNTLFNRYQRVKEKVLGVFTQAVWRKNSFAFILSQIVAIRESEDFKKLSVQLRYKIEGLIDGGFAMMYTHLIWVHEYDGKYVGTRPPYGDGFDQTKLVSYNAYKEDVTKIYSTKKDFNNE